ncbi:hypothetical protein LTR94_032833, partial [Friedmanniomyces endolithicus]
MAGDAAGRLARAAIGQARVIAQARQIQRLRRLRGRLGVAQIAARIQHRQPHSAIQQAGVQVRQAVMGGQARGDGALAGRGGAVDGDDQVLVQIRVPSKRYRALCFSRLRLQDASDPEASEPENQQNRAGRQHGSYAPPEQIGRDRFRQVQGGVAVHTA